MRIEDALSQVRSIQTQLARTERYCCYRWATVATSGLLAILAAIVQSVVLPDPAFALRGYLSLWVGIAALSVLVIATEIVLRWQQTRSCYAHRQTLAALRQFAPCLVAGALLTWAIAAAAPEHGDLLPGLWAMCFSLGVFASAAHLPPGGDAVGAYYLASGIACVVFGRGQQALQPWTMIVTFAAGQCLAAWIIYQRNEQLQ